MILCDYGRAMRGYCLSLRRTLAIIAFALGLNGAAAQDNAASPAPSASPSVSASPSSSPAAGSAASPAPAASAAPTTLVPLDQLMAQGPLPDLVQGKASASVTIIEYASMTCTHCAAFHDTVWPTLKTKYIDTGKVKFILREFPLDPLATAGFMLARCLGPEKRDGLVDQLFAQQKAWAFGDKPIEALLGIVKQAGMTQIDFETCLKNQELYDQVNQSRDGAAKNFNIDSTPTFFINGRKFNGELAIGEIEKIIDPLLK